MDGRTDGFSSTESRLAVKSFNKKRVNSLGVLGMERDDPYGLFGPEEGIGHSAQAQDQSTLFDHERALSILNNENVRS